VLPKGDVMAGSLQVAAVVSVVVLAASMVSVELGISIAVIEILLGVVVGNLLGLQAPEWMVFLAGFGSILLTFLAGAEVDPEVLRERLVASLAIGGLSFALPFVGALLVARYGLGWEWPAAEIAGAAMSTTSLAVVYAVLVETGLTQTAIGKLIMAATFVTDLGTAAALSILFLRPNRWTIPFVLVSGLLIVGMPRLERWFFTRYGNRVIEPELKGAFAALLVLMWLGELAHSHAVLPAFLLGLALARTFARRQPEQQRLRVVAFALLTPFFFIRSGMNVSLAAVGANLGLLGLFLLVKLTGKFVGVWPLARRYARPHATYLTLLMSTGLTFGTIAATYGLNAGIIDRAQFSVLVSVVVVTAVVPTAIAQRRFTPQAEPASQRVGAPTSPADGPHR
jgi:Kef-type K+ transport system membrane component KefB